MPQRASSCSVLRQNDGGSLEQKPDSNRVTGTLLMFLFAFELNLRDLDTEIGIEVNHGK
jgi:hypothetical protein